jgi:hypothetical protein
MWVVVTVVAVVVVIATYVTWAATRVDRLHARAAAAYAALDAQSLRRASAAEEWGRSRGVVEVQIAAKAVVGAHPDEREAAENALTRTLRSAATSGDEVRAAPVSAAVSLDAVQDASRRLALARQVHTDLVRDALAVRRHPVVRLLRLARRHSEPRFFDIDEPALDV